MRFMPRPPGAWDDQYACIMCLRDRITVSIGISDEEAEKKAMASEVVQAALEEKEVKKVIVVAGKLVNIVV